ncbi:MAG: DUF1214 domain-containing protein [Rubrivivax sp.]|nr:DUF1214 domain-containing protein [Rubrivivax sp.]
MGPTAPAPHATPAAPARRATRRLVAAALLLAAGVLVGLASAWWSVRPQAAFGAAVGPWRVSLLAGSADADATTRARVALGGLLALNRSETMYYVATHDSAGRPLRARCRYRITGAPPAARWWSLTAYADDYFLFADDARRYSVNGANARLDERGRFTVWTGPQAPPPSAAPSAPGGAGGAGDTWLPTPGDRGLVLTLRVYNPQPLLQASPSSLAPPAIEAEGSCA